jgi:hypothetical protein
MKLFDKLFGSSSRDPIHVTDPAILDRFLSNPHFPWLVSFPRTGSHWLRMIMELYFGKPSLRRIFYFPEATEYTCYHWHDVDLTTRDVKSVIYLYRHPVDTVYSTLRYHKEDVTDAQRVRHWTEAYARHLAKWILDETFTVRKSTIRYENLREKPVEEFGKVCAHLDSSVDAGRLQDAMARVSKGELKKLTGHDDQVVNLSQDYDAQRSAFRARFDGAIMDGVTAVDARLVSLWTAEG